MNKIKYVFVDGYNVICSWENLRNLKDENLEDARDKLIEMLEEYTAIKGYETYVVFDAHYVKGSFEKKEKKGKVKIIYTSEGESADCYIERKVAELSKEFGVAAVTSDYLEQRIVLQMGGIRITPKELYLEVKNLMKTIKEKSQIKYHEKKNLIADRVDGKVLEELEKMRRNP